MGILANNKHYDYHTPRYLHVALCQGDGTPWLSPRGHFHWQDAIDFLRDVHSCHIAIIPAQTLTPPYHVFDFIIFSPYQEEEGIWKDDKMYERYYDALGAAILKCVNDIRKSRGLPPAAKPTI
jgi:hypothetical protein